MTAKTPTADDPFAPPARLPRLGALWRTRRHAPWPLRYGLALPLALGLMHLVGLREWVGVVSGTPVPGVPFAVAAPVGFVYVLTWLATLALAPPMLLAGAVELGLRRRGRAASKGEADSARAPGPRDEP